MAVDQGLSWSPTITIEDRIYTEREFVRQNFVGSLFSKVKFVRCRFVDCDLSHAVFRECDVYDCIFENAMLYYCQFVACELTKTDFSESYMSGIRFRGCDLTRTRFGTTLKIGVNRKIESLPEGSRPERVQLTEPGAGIPPVAELEKRFEGIGVLGGNWYIQFKRGMDSEARKERRRSVLASHIANELISFGRGDAAPYCYLARKCATKATPFGVRRVMRLCEDQLWGYGFRPLRLLRAILIANILAIVSYVIVAGNGWGHLADHDQMISANLSEEWPRHLYYSVVVAATLGFGDIVPLGKCRTVLVAQVVMNVVLVGLGISVLTSPWREWRIPEGLDE